MRQEERKTADWIEQVEILATYRQDKFLIYLARMAKNYLETMDPPLWETPKACA